MFIPSRPFLPVDETDARTVELACFPRQAIPIVVKLLLRRIYRSSFVVEQHRTGRDMIVRCIVSLYAACENNTAEAVDRVYRLLDAALYGRVYANAGTPDEPNIVPAIGLIPNVGELANESMVARSRQSALAIDNITTGTANDEYTDTRNIRQQLEDILAAIQNGDGGNTDDILAVVQQIALLLA